MTDARFGPAAELPPNDERPALHVVTVNGHKPPDGVPVMDDIALRGLAGDFVRRVEPHTEADPNALLLQFLCAAGNLFGRDPHVLIEGNEHPGNLYLGIVGDTSSGRKGTSWGRVRQVLERTDADWVRNLGNGLSSGEGLKWAGRDPIYKMVQPKKQGRPDGEPFEELVDEGVTDKRVLVKEAEMSRMLRSMNRQANTLSPVIRELWDSGDARSMSKNDPGKATGAMLSIIAHTTADELRRELTEIEAANGFSNRFLWVYSRRSKLLPRGGELAERDLDEIADWLRQAKTAASVQQRMDFDAAAWKMWEDSYERLTRDQPGISGAIVARGAPQVRRLSLIYALLDTAGEIRAEHLESALAVWAYCEACVRLIFGEASGYPDADRALSFIRESTHQGRTRTEIRDLFGRNKNIEPIVLYLAKYELASAHNDPGDVGRPTERWVASEYDLNDQRPPT